ncbi:MAG TPA: PH domain-containing protein, partial [Thermomicrobiales bacterium]|nr:PH domain-containing protein [Thermomicrobiales bacterium]
MGRSEADAGGPWGRDAERGDGRFPSLDRAGFVSAHPSGAEAPAGTRATGNEEPEEPPRGVAFDAAPGGADLPPRRQHPAWIAISAVRQLRGFAVPLLVLLVSRGRDGDGRMLAIPLAIALATVVWQAVAWRFVSYAVEDGRFRVESGVFGRRERFVPVERVQAVDLGETPLQRLFGVVGVRIETAAGGSGQADVTLQAVRRADAETLRQTLLRDRARSGALATADEPAGAASRDASAAAAGGELLRKLGVREVLIVGATSGRIGPALAALSFGFQFLDDLLPDRFWRLFALQAPGYGLRGLLLAVGVGAVVAWGLSIVGAVLTWSAFELRRDGDRLLISHGLLDRRRRSVPLARLQAVSVREAPLRRLFGLAEVRFESAGFAGSGGEAGVLLPLLPLAEAPALLAAATPGFAPPPRLALAGPPPRARGRYLGDAVRPLLGLLAVVLVLAALPAVRWWWTAAVLVLLPLAFWDGLLAFRQAGWAIDDGRLVLREGGLSRRTVVAPLGRLQWRSVVQTPLA